MSASAAPPPTTPPGAISALVLGILAVCGAWFVGPWAWHKGRKLERIIADSGGRLSGGELAKAGKIMGMIGCVWSLPFLVLMALLIFDTGFR